MKKIAIVILALCLLSVACQPAKSVENTVNSEETIRTENVLNLNDALSVENALSSEEAKRVENTLSSKNAIRTENVLRLEKTTNKKTISQEQGKTYRTADNLRLRPEEGVAGETLFTLPKYTPIIIRAHGKIETIDNITANWIQVEVAEDTVSVQGDEIKKGAVGWCFGGYVTIIPNTDVLTLPDAITLYEDDEAETYDGTDNRVIERIRDLVAKSIHASSYYEILEYETDTWSDIFNNYTALLYASEFGYTEVVKSLISEGADIEVQCDREKATALLLSAMNGHTKIVTALIEAGANIDVQDDDNETALILAARQGHTDVIKALIEAGANIDSETKNNSSLYPIKHTALMVAARSGYPDIVNVLKLAGGGKSELELIKTLATQGINATDADNDNYTPLMYASIYGYTEVVKALIADGADIEVKTYVSLYNRNTLDDYTALILATGAGQTDVVKLLLVAGADIEAQDGDNKTALMTAASYGHTEVVKSLIEAGADIHAADSGKTALVFSAWNGHTDTLKFLIEAGATIDALSSYNHTIPLIYAASDGHTEAVKVLLEAGANIEAQDGDSYTALVYAATNGHTESLAVLLEAGANVDAKTESRSTALSLTAMHGHTEVVEALIRAGADLDAQSDYGTALSRAEDYNNQDIVDLLTVAIQKEEKALQEALLKLSSSLQNAISLYEGRNYTKTIKELIVKDLNATTHDGNTPLMYASKYGYTEIVKALIEDGANLDVQKKDGDTALAIAVSEEQTEATQLLIEAGANLETRDEYGRTALMWATLEEQTDFVKILIEAGADIEVRDEDGTTVLMKAASKRDTEIVKLLIEAGADIKAKKEDGWMAYHYAARYSSDILNLLASGLTEAVAKTTLSPKNVSNLQDAIALYEGEEDIEVIKELVAKDINAISSKLFYTPLTYASKYGYIEIVKALIEADVNIEARSVFEWTALLSAAENGHAEVVKALIEAGANTNAKNDDDWTAFMIASDREHAEVLKVLIDAGVDLEEKDINGNTALMLAVTENRTEVCKLLLEAGVNLEEKDINGNTALMLAVSEENIDMVKALLKTGSDINAKTMFNWTTLMEAADNGFTEVLALLIAGGADINAQSNTGWTAVMYASIWEHTDIVTLLTEAGADLSSEQTETKLVETVLVEAGSFQMGLNDEDEQAGHTVTLTTDYYIGKYEVTQKLYYDVTGHKPSTDNFTTEWEKLPVELVTWYEVIEFCNALSELEGLKPYYSINKTKTDSNNTSDDDDQKWTVTMSKSHGAEKGYRLPTEAEWEYAARGGKTGDHSLKYAGSNSIGNVAWYGGNTGVITQEVGTRRPNSLGLYDMSGNVGEWCWDWYGDYSSENSTNPTGATEGSSRILRGGSCNNYASGCSVVSRDNYTPSSKSFVDGFRVVRSQ